LLGRHTWLVANRYLFQPLYALIIKDLGPQFLLK